DLEARRLPARPCWSRKDGCDQGERQRHGRLVHTSLECYRPVSATASAISDFTPGTMLLASAFSSSRCGECSSTAPIATAGIPIAIALLASVDPTSAGTMGGVPDRRK